uniref:Uncharacterized protein n=1 Tax=viral metagenome TaxID=1070528 RepID=A0A6C0JW17_9ZZZZ
MPCVSSSHSAQILLQSCCTTATGCGCNTAAYFANSLCSCYPVDNAGPRNVTLCDALDSLSGFSGATGSFETALDAVLLSADACNCFVGGIYDYSLAGSLNGLVQSIACGATGSIAFPGGMAVSGTTSFLRTVPTGLTPETTWFGPQCAQITIV